LPCFFYPPYTLYPVIPFFFRTGLCEEAAILPTKQSLFYALSFFCLSRGVLRGMCPLKINKAIPLCATLSLQTNGVSAAILFLLLHLFSFTLFCLFFCFCLSKGVLRECVPRIKVRGKRVPSNKGKINSRTIS